MASFARSQVTAVLGPTNTGKTHLAVERLCAHASGIMGFPLRLLAREVYDRVVAIKGAAQVGLITGEEKILPPTARYLLCTAESMPMEREAAFISIDEIQLGADAERGHVFTDRLLNARGYAETMLLGSAGAGGLVRSLLPEAEIVGRPRFSTLSYAGAKKLARLPRRSAIVAFSAEDVYAIAEGLRRLKGGAAVVMGALSPSTRNAQVALFQSGEVDYLVATDAIGMGLNLDVHHIAFASLTKFDGRRTRRLTLSEMAQIAGRAGRHQRDGSFGTVGAHSGVSFTPEEIEAIEAHVVPRLPQFYWRRGDPSLASVDALIADLELTPERPELRAAPEAVDLAVLKRLADDRDVAARARGDTMVRRLWDVCGVPDFLKMGADHHARLVQRLWTYRSTGSGHIDHRWFTDQLARLDRVEGDVETLSARIAHVRTWCYIAHRPGWLADSDAMAARAREIESKLSDALHQRLTQRFVNRRTSVLMRGLGEGADALPVTIGDDRSVSVDGETIGALHGFRFVADPAASADEHKMLLAAAEKHLNAEYRRRVAALAATEDKRLTLTTAPGETPTVAWDGDTVARLDKGASLLKPTVKLDRHVTIVASAQEQAAIVERIRAWIDTQVDKRLAPLKTIGDMSRSAEATPQLRALLAPLAEAGGIIDRRDLDAALTALDQPSRLALRTLGVTIGTLDIFQPALLKPEAMRWRLALLGLWQGAPMPAMPPESAVKLDPETREAALAANRAGFRSIGRSALRLDLIERIARDVHKARVAQEQADEQAAVTAAANLGSGEDAPDAADAPNEPAADSSSLQAGSSDDSMPKADALAQVDAEMPADAPEPGLDLVSLDSGGADTPEPIAGRDPLPEPEPDINDAVAAAITAAAEAPVDATSEESPVADGAASDSADDAGADDAVADDPGATDTAAPLGEPALVPTADRTMNAPVAETPTAGAPEQPTVAAPSRSPRGAPTQRRQRPLFRPDPALAVSLGLDTDSFGQLLTMLGFQSVSERGEDGAPVLIGWRWRGRRSGHDGPRGPRDRHPRRGGHQPGERQGRSHDRRDGQRDASRDDDRRPQRPRKPQRADKAVTGGNRPGPHARHHAAKSERAADPNSPFAALAGLFGGDKKGQ